MAELASILDTWAPRTPHAKAVAEANGGLAIATKDFDASKFAEIDHLSKASGRNVLAGLIETFLAALPERLASMESAIDREDFESFAAEAVALRRSSSAIGAARFERLCADAEHLARSGDRGAARRPALGLIRYGRSLPHILRRAAAAPD